MAQHDYVIDNQTAPNFRSDLNNVLSAIVSTNSGGTAPSTTYANMLWYDTAANILKIRNEGNDAWISIGTLDQSLDTFAANVAIATQVQAEAGTNNTTTMTPLRTAQAIAALAGVSVTYQAFTSSGTWTKPSGATLVYVEIWGGGASGTSRRGTSSNSGGGGGGGFISRLYQASDLGATVSVTVGAGGAARVRTTNGLTVGANGGSSSFGSLSVGGGLGSGFGAQGETNYAVNYSSGSVSGSAGTGSDAANAYVNGANASWGGAGGGARGSINGSGGTSWYGGNGGAAGTPTGVAGSVRGGGGGGAAAGSGTVTSGAGGRGEVRVWAW